MAQWGNCELIDLRVAGSNPAGQLLIYFHNVFPVLAKILCRHANLVPRSHIKAFVCKPRRCSLRPLFKSPSFGFLLRKRLSTVVRNIFGGPSCPLPPILNRVEEHVCKNVLAILMTYMETRCNIFKESCIVSTSFLESHYGLSFNLIPKVLAA